MSKSTTPQINPQLTTPKPDSHTITPEQIIQAANGAVVLDIDRCVELTGNTIKRKTFFNLLTQGDAPRRLKVGRRTCLNTAEFAEWFCNRLQAA